MAVMDNFYFSIFLRLTWEFLGLENERRGSVCWPNNKIRWAVVNCIPFEFSPTADACDLPAQYWSCMRNRTRCCRVNNFLLDHVVYLIASSVHIQILIDEGNRAGTSSVLDFQRFNPARVPNADVTFNKHALCYNLQLHKCTCHACVPVSIADYSTYLCYINPPRGIRS